MYLWKSGWFVKVLLVEKSCKHPLLGIFSNKPWEKIRYLTDAIPNLNVFLGLHGPSVDHRAHGYLNYSLLENLKGLHRFEVWSKFVLLSPLLTKAEWSFSICKQKMTLNSYLQPSYCDHWSISLRPPQHLFLRSCLAGYDAFTHIYIYSI